MRIDILLFYLDRFFSNISYAKIVLNILLEHLVLNLHDEFLKHCLNFYYKLYSIQFFIHSCQTFTYKLVSNMR